MRKQFTFITILILICGSMSFGQQTGSLNTVIASPGESVSIPMTVGGGWNIISSINLGIRYKKDVLTFTGLTGVVSGLTGYVVHGDDSTVYFVWTSMPPAIPTLNLSGVIFYLNFVYNGATSSTLHFLPFPDCDIETGIPPTQIYPIWTDGAVNPKTNNNQTATLGNPTSLTGSLVTVPLRYAGFGAYGTGHDVGSITQKIHFDPSKLSFVNISATGSLVGAIGWASNGILTISWTNTTGQNIDFLASPSNQININFIYNGNTTANVEFYPGCLITTFLAANIPVSYFNGTVTPGVNVGTAVLGNITGALQGQDYEVPLNLTFPTGITSLTLNIIFNSPRLSFIGITSPAQPGILENTHGDTISIVYTYYTPPIPSVNGTFLKLKFKYNGIGVANVMFGPGCLFTNLLYNPVQTAYTNATITPAIVTPNANIEYVSATPGSDVLVPIDFSSLPTNMGAVTMYILFDPSKLSFIDAQNNIHLATVGNSQGKVNIAWASSIYPGGEDINGTFLKLRFHYLGGGGASVTFTDECVVADITPTIVPVNWNNGGVNIGFKVSGILTYNSAPNPDIPLNNFTVYLKNGPEPGGTIILTTTTNSSGYFEFPIVSNGSYYLYAFTTRPQQGVTTTDATLVYLKATFVQPLPYENPLRLKAADVDINGQIQTTDATIIYLRATFQPSPNFLAPNWYFENPSITVNGADVIQNFHGICSGDVNGDNPNP